MPLILTLKSGRQHFLKGETWKPFGAPSPLGTMLATTLTGHGMLIIKSEIGTVEEISDNEWNAGILEEKEKLAAAAAQKKAGEEAAAARKPLAWVKRLLHL